MAKPEREAQQARLSLRGHVAGEDEAPVIEVELHAPFEVRAIGPVGFAAPQLRQCDAVALEPRSRVEGEWPRSPIRRRSPTQLPSRKTTGSLGPAAPDVGMGYPSPSVGRCPK